MKKVTANDVKPWTPVMTDAKMKNDDPPSWRTDPGMIWASHSMYLKTVLKKVALHLHADPTIEARELMKEVENAIKARPSDIYESGNYKTEGQRALAEPQN